MTNPSMNATTTLEPGWLYRLASVALVIFIWPLSCTRMQGMETIACGPAGFSRSSWCTYGWLEWCETSRVYHSDGRVESESTVDATMLAVTAAIASAALGMAVGTWILGRRARRGTQHTSTPRRVRSHPTTNP